MPRYFAPISEEELEKKIEETFNANGNLERQVLDKLASDIKVNFDLENTDLNVTNWEGYHTLSNGFTFLGLSGAGDWETAVFFIVYWDGKKLRAYVPTEGNPWNTSTKQAYGNDEEADLKNARKRWPDCPDDLDGWFDHDDDEIQKDILHRILPIPSGLTPKKVNVTGKPARRINVTGTPARRIESLADRINALKYYAPDEGEELFQATCSLCYKMYGLGDTVKAETLYLWAKEQAESSKEFSEQEGRDDFVDGYWGN